MTGANGSFGTAAVGSAILLARIVDGAGRPVRRSEIDAIEYSVHQFGPYASEAGDAIPDHNAVTVDVGDAIFDSLQTDGLWMVDEVGYNFRHEIDIGRFGVIAASGGRFEVQYVLTPSAGEKTIVRFRLDTGCSMLDGM